MTELRDILVVDDDKSIRYSLTKILSKEGYQVAAVEDGQAALDYLQRHSVHLILTDLRMPRLDGLQLIRRVHHEYPQIALILMTAYGNLEIAIEVMKEGAVDYIEKPLKRAEVMAVLRRGWMRQALMAQGEKPCCPGELVGRSEVIRALIAQIQQAAQSSTVIFIEGEKGTGKRSVAQAIHCLSERRGAFVVVDHAQLCGALASEIPRGDSETSPLWQRVEGGTLFVGELNAVPEAIRERLRQKVRNVHGGDKGFRLTASMSSPLPDAEKERWLSEEAGGGMLLQIPPLRERSEDLPLLIGHFLGVYRNKHGKSVQRISDTALDMLLEYSWPGNVRELEESLAFAVGHAQTEEIRPEDLPESLTKHPPTSEIPRPHPETRLENLERRVILETLARARGQSPRTCTGTNPPDSWNSQGKSGGVHFTPR